MTAIVDKLIDYARRLQAELDSGADLRALSNKSYEDRAADASIPYMKMLDISGKTVTRIAAWPTSAQRELAKLFAEKAPGSALPRYKFEVTLDGVTFTERLGRGVGNARDLLAGGT